MDNQYRTVAVIETNRAGRGHRCNNFCGTYPDNRQFVHQFINSTLEVIDDTMHSVIGIYYTSYIVYSSPEGNVMASTLVTLLQQWLLEAEENEMQVTIGETHLVIYKPCALDKSNSNSKSLCLTSLVTELQKNGIDSSAPSPSPLESSLNIPCVQSPAVIAGTFIGGILAGTLCTVIAALSWFVIKYTYTSNYNSSWYNLRRFFFSHAVCLCARCSQVISLTTQT